MRSRRRRHKWLRPLIVAGMTVAGLALALYALPALANDFTQLLRARSLSAVPLLPVVVIALVFWATISAAASEN